MLHATTTKNGWQFCNGPELRRNECGHIRKNELKLDLCAPHRAMRDHFDFRIYFGAHYVCHASSAIDFVEKMFSLSPGCDGLNGIGVACVALHSCTTKLTRDIIARIMDE